MTDPFLTVLEAIDALSDVAPDDTAAANAVAAILHIQPMEAICLCVAVTEACRPPGEGPVDRDDEDDETAGRVIAFAIGLKLGERIGFGRGTALFSPPPEQQEA